MLIVFLSLVCVLSLWCLHSRFSRDGRLLAKIPGPKGVPIFGNAFQFLGSPEKIFMKSRELYSTYKGVIKLQALYFRSVNIYDPEDMATVLSSASYHEKSITYKFFRPWLNDGLLTSNGHKWHHRRKMLTPAFHLNILKKFLEIFIIQTEHLQKNIEMEVSNEKTNLYELVSPVALKIVCESAMGLSRNRNIDFLFDKYFNSIETFGKCLFQRICRVWYFYDWVFDKSATGKKQNKTIRYLHSVSEDVVRDRRQYLAEHNTGLFDSSTGINKTKGRLAMMDILIQNEKDKKIDALGIREEVDTFLYAGYDTVSTTLTFFFMRIANEPEIQAKIHEEIESIFGDSDRMPTTEDLHEMKYTECCIKESLRMYPSVPYISRYLKNDLVLGGYKVPGNTHINIMIYDLHQREDIYPEPKKFIPERFLPENHNKRHPYSYIPFSAGYRNCIGQKYAMIEMKTMISGIFRKYRVEPVTRPQDIVFAMDIVLRTSKPIYAKFCKK